MQTLIKLENVEKIYRVGDILVQALDKVSLKINEK